MNSVIPLKRHESVREAPDQLVDLTCKDMEAVEEIITRQSWGAEEMIQKLAGHILRSGGKRLRPMLVLASARLCDYRGTAHHHLAACIEFLHTATLLHDDVVDAATLRRGQRSANVIWGGKASVLVGDFLLARSFTMMLESRSLDILAVLSRTASVISEGEIRQMTIAQSVDIGESTYLEVIEAKTASLFAAACRIGAMLVGSPRAQADALYDYGLNLGIAYQLMDDRLDYGGGTALWGKERGVDFREGKVTLPVLLAYRRGDQSQRDFWHRCLSEQRQRSGDLDRACALIDETGAGADIIERARHYAEIARDSLGMFESGPAQRALLDTLDFCLRRRS